MKGSKKIIFVVLSTLFSLLFYGRAAFAVEEITVTLSNDTVSITSAPGIFVSGGQTVTVTTQNTGGFNASLVTLGNNTSLIHQNDSSIMIPTFTLPSGATSLPANNTGYGYGYSVDGGTTYMPVPTPQTTGDQIFSSDTDGTSSHNLTFGIKPTTNTVAGIYRKQF